MSNEENTTTALTTGAKNPLAIGQRGIELSDLDGLWRFSVAVAKSGLAPKGIQTPEGITVAIQMGLEVGLTPMASLQNIAVINGRPAMWGDAQLAVCRGTGEMEVFEEWFEVEGERLPRNPIEYPDALTAVCQVKRRGYPVAEVGFSVADAKRAKLWGKQGPWTEYPFRMLKARARGFALRDQFGDALRGLMSAEEVQDMPKERNVTPTAAPIFSKPMAPGPDGVRGDPGTGNSVGAEPDETKAAAPSTSPAKKKRGRKKKEEEAPKEGTPASGGFALEAPPEFPKDASPFERVNWLREQAGFTTTEVMTALNDLALTDLDKLPMVENGTLEEVVNHWETIKETITESRKNEQK